MKALQVDFALDYNKDAVDDMQITVMTIPLKSQEQVQSAEVLVALVDSMDRRPGDQVADITSQISLPVIKIFGLQLKASAILDAKFRVVDI